MLEGFGKYLEDITFLKLEVVFEELYKGQLLFCKIHEYLTSKNFQLLDLKKQGVFGYLFVEGNAVYENKESKLNDNIKKLIREYLTS